MLYRSILLTRLVTDSGTCKGHPIDLWFDRFLGLVKGIIKKAWLEAITKQPKAVQKKANYIPDPVSACKVSLPWEYCINIILNCLLTILILFTAI